MAKGLARVKQAAAKSEQARNVTSVWEGSWFEVKTGRAQALIGEDRGNLYRGMRTEERGAPPSVEWERKPFSTIEREERRAREHERKTREMFGPER